MTQSRVHEITDAVRSNRALAAAIWRSTTTNPAFTYAYAYAANRAAKHGGCGTWRSIE